MAKFACLAVVLLRPCLGLQLEYWSTTAFAGPGSVSNVSDINFNPATWETSNFTIETDGNVRFWVDDNLLVDDPTQQKVRAVHAVCGYPFTAGKTVPFRLEYTHFTGTPYLILSWIGNSTLYEVVPATAFGYAVRPADVERQALRDRLYNPPIAWQTYYNPSMGAHVQMPTGLAMVVTLQMMPPSNVSLGNIFVYRRSSPAIVRIGPHSYNGSVFTELTISAWNGMHCDVMLQTTTVGGPAGGDDLQFLATSNGTDCHKMALLLQPQVLFGHYGQTAAGPNGQLTSTLPGFPDVTAYSTGPGIACNVTTPGAYLCLPLPSDPAGGQLGFSTGQPATVQAMAVNIAAARAVQVAHSSIYGDLATCYEATQSVIAWNTMFNEYEGVLTPVSRGWNFDRGYVIFDWDNLLVAYQASLEDGIPLDLARNNLIQILLARTLEGFVPNYSAATDKSYDRTEPQIGALVLSRIYAKWGDAGGWGWVVDLVLDALISWNDWVWNRRRGEGVLSPPDDKAPLIVLGSDPNFPPGDGSSNTMQGARYESGLDNSPMYDSPPVTFDNITTHHMELYDVGMTAFYLSDTAALIELLVARDRPEVVPTLLERFNTVADAVNKYMWDPSTNIYTNILYNGSYYRRYSPTSVFPLISGIASDAQVVAMVNSLIANPAGLCLNGSHTGPANNAMLQQWWDADITDNAGCLTDACMGNKVTDKYNYIRIEALALNMSAGPAPGLLPLYQWYSATNNDNCLTTNATAPQSSYVLLNQEGWCYATPGDAPPGSNLVQLTLWWNAKRLDYQTCGSTGCITDVHDSGYTFVTNLCYAYYANSTDALPCKFGGNSIARSDPAFYDNTYWRGRIWGPHLQLLYWSLERYDHLPEARAARLTLVDQGRRLLEQDWNLFRHVNENMNGVIGVGSDVGDADPMYHWGALAGFMSFEERHIY